MAKTAKRKAKGSTAFQRDLEERRALMQQLRAARDDRRKLLALDRQLRAAVARSDERLDALGIALMGRTRFEPATPAARVLAAAERAPEN